MNSKKQMVRSALPKSKSKAVLVFFPPETVKQMDEAARRLDTDRSKFIRGVIRRALASTTN